MKNFYLDFIKKWRMLYIVDIYFYVRSEKVKYIFPKTWFYLAWSLSISRGWL